MARLLRALLHLRDVIKGTKEAERREREIDLLVKQLDVDNELTKMEG